MQKGKGMAGLLGGLLHRNLLDVSQLRKDVFESKTARSEKIQILLWAKNRTVCAGGRLLSRR